MAKGFLDKNEQTKLKGLSKVISILAIIGKFFLYFGIVSIILCMIIAPTFIKRIKTYDDKIELTYSQETLSIVKDSSSTVRIYVNDKEQSKIMDEKEFNDLKKVLDKHSNKTLIGYFEAIALIIILYMYLISLVLKHLERLFKNINKGQTPFTLDNVKHMEKMGLFMIAAIVLPSLTSLIFYIVTDYNFNISLNFVDIVEILFVFAMSFVFRYGYILQEDSKKTIYDDED